METIGVIGFRKVVEDFAAVCKTIKQELENPDLTAGIKDEVIKLGNQMDAELNALGETLKPIVGTLEEQEAASTIEEIHPKGSAAEVEQELERVRAADMENEGAPATTDAEPDATGNDAPLEVK